MRIVQSPHPALISLVLLAGILSSELRAREAAIQGARSPNSRFEVRLLNDPALDPADFGFRIFDRKAQRYLPQHSEFGGVDRFEAALEQSRAFWDSTNRRVAVTDRPTAESQEIYLLEVSNGSVHQLVFPDLRQHLLAQLGVPALDLGFFCQPRGWENDRLLLSIQFGSGSQSFYYECALECIPSKPVRLLKGAPPKLAELRQ